MFTMKINYSNTFLDAYEKYRYNDRLFKIVAIKLVNHDIGLINTTWKGLATNKVYCEGY